MGSEKTEPFDVVNMGNILEFHWEDSNLHICYVFKFQNPFNKSKKIFLS